MEVKISDLTFFKNEILDDLKKLEKRLNDKILSQINIFLANINSNKDQITKQNNKIVEIMDIIKSLEEKIKTNTDSSSVKSKLDEFSFINNTKFNSLEKEMNDISFKYDKLFVKNLTCPGLIGNHCQFPNTRAYFEFIDKRLKEISKSKDIQVKDLKMYKEKLESLINQFRLEMDSMDAKITLRCNQILHKFEIGNNEKLLEFDEKLKKMRVENENTITSKLNKRFENFDSQWDKMREFRDNILERFETKTNEIITENQKSEKKYNEFMEEFMDELNKIKSRFDETQRLLKNYQIINNGNNTYNYTNYIDNSNNISSQDKYASINADEKKIKNNNNDKSFNNENKNSDFNEENKRISNKEEMDKESNDTKTIKIKLNKKNIDKDNLKENIDKEISKPKIKGNTNIYLKKENNINKSGPKTEREYIKDNLKLIKKEFLKKESNKIAKKWRNSSLINNDISNLNENCVNINKIKEDNNKINNNTITKRILMKNGTFFLNSTNPNISNSDINNSKTKFNFYQNFRKKQIHGMKNNEVSYINDKYENSQFHNFAESKSNIFNFNKKNEKKIKKNNSMNEIYIGNNPRLYKINQSNYVNNNISSEVEQYLSKEEFCQQMNETKENLNYLYLKLNLKIQKINRQIKNLAAEVFQYSFNKKLNNKYLSLFTKNKSAKNITNSPKTKYLNERKQDLTNIPRINDNLTFTEDEKISSQDFLEQIDFFLIKKFKD